MKFCAGKRSQTSRASILAWGTSLSLANQKHCRDVGKRVSHFVSTNPDTRGFFRETFPSAVISHWKALQNALVQVVTPLQPFEDLQYRLGWDRKKQPTALIAMGLPARHSYPRMSQWRRFGGRFATRPRGRGARLVSHSLCDSLCWFGVKHETNKQ